PLPRFQGSRHGPDQGPYRPLCCARARPVAAIMGSDRREARAAGARRSHMARRRDGHLCAGKTDRLDARPFAAAGYAVLPLARAGAELLFACRTVIIIAALWEET